MSTRAPAPAAGLARVLEGAGARHGVLWLAAVALLFAGASRNEVHDTAVFYASLARDMADSGDPLAPYRGAHAWLLKPPLVLWLSALSIAALGPTSLAATLVPRLFGLALAALTFLLARRLYDPASAWWATVVVTINSVFIQYTTTLRMDSALTAGIVLAMLGWLDRDRPWGPAAFCGGLTLGVLAKGPAGLAPLALAALHGLLEGRAPRHPRRWLAAAVLLAPALLWYAWLWRAHGAEAFAELAADATHGGAGGMLEQLRSAAWSYGLRPLLRDWYWAPFVAGGALLALREAGARATPDRRRRARAGLILAWAGGTVAIATLKPDHDLRYLYPALPAIALLGGLGLARLTRARVPGWAVATLAVATLGFTVVVAGTGRVVHDPRPAIAEMQRALAARADPGAPVPVLGVDLLPPGSPRRQNRHTDWVRYYLGRPARLLRARSARPAELAGEPLVLVARHVDPAIRARLGLRLRARTGEMLLMAPRGAGGDRALIENSDENKTTRR